MLAGCRGPLVERWGLAEGAWGRHSLGSQGSASTKQFQASHLEEAMEETV